MGRALYTKTRPPNGNFKHVVRSNSDVSLGVDLLGVSILFLPYPVATRPLVFTPPCLQGLLAFKATMESGQGVKYHRFTVSNETAVFSGTILQIVANLELISRVP